MGVDEQLIRQGGKVMTQEALWFFGIIMIPTLMFMALERHERRLDREASQEAYLAGYQEGYEEAACRAYMVTEASLQYPDWNAFREYLDRIDD